MTPGRLRNVITGVCEILDGTASVLTVGGYHPRLAIRFTFWAETAYLKKLSQAAGRN